MATILLRSQQGRISLTSDNFNGSDCSGSDKTTNRTLNVPKGIGLVIVERKLIHPTSDYTVSGTTITFLIRIDNRMKISVFR